VAARTVCCRLQCADSVVLHGRPSGLYPGNPLFHEKIWRRRRLCDIVQQFSAADAPRSLEVFCLLEAQNSTAQISCIKQGERRSAATSPADLPAIFPYRRANIR